MSVPRRWCPDVGNAPCSAGGDGDPVAGLHREEGGKVGRPVGGRVENLGDLEEVALEAELGEEDFVQLRTLLGRLNDTETILGERNRS